MCKVYLLWVLCIKTILTQSMFNEKIREPRQLDFGECCPCSDLQNKVNDRNILTSTKGQSDENCPCKLTPDSEHASSIFRPAMRAVEPFMRPLVTKEEPEPLLKPEVGLANSVLETLREVTDQEYKEALVRDAARNTIKAMEQNLFDGDTPKNIVNIILKPKETVDDALAEASNLKETRCIHSSLSNLGGVNRLGQIRPQNKLLDLFSLPKGTSDGYSHNKLSDMANSASNLKEQVLPMKTTILDDLRLKSNLLKLKLFPNLRNGLKNTKSNDDTTFPPRLNHDCDDFIKKAELPIPESTSVLNHLISYKEDNFEFTPSDNNYVLTPDESIDMKNKILNEYLPSNKITNPNSDVSDFYNTNLDKVDNFPKKDEEPSSIDESGVEFAPFVQNNFDKEKLLVKDSNVNECNVDINKQDLGETEILDTVPSPFELKEIEDTMDERDDTLNTSTNFKIKEIPNDDDSNVSMQDLQQMSNHILELSEISSRDSENTRESANCSTDILEKFNSNSKATTIKNTLTYESLPETSTEQEPAKVTSKPFFDFESSEELVYGVNSNNINQQNNPNILLHPTSINNPCNISALKDSDIKEKNMEAMNNNENEMMSQASSPYVNSVPHINTLNKAFNAKPEVLPNLNVIQFLENLQSSVSDILNNDRDKYTKTNIYKDNENENTNINTEFLKKRQQSYLIKPSLKSIEPKNMDVSNSYSKQNRGDELFSAKSNYNLNPYKAKVASPLSLNIKSLQAPRKTKQNDPQRLFNDNTQNLPTSHILRNPLELPNVLSLKPPKNIVNDFDPKSNLKNVLQQDAVPITGLSTISENLKSRTEDAFQNIRDTFDATFKKQKFNSNNNLLGENFKNPLTFKTYSNSDNDISKRLQDLHTELMDRLSIVSQRKPLDNISRKIKSNFNGLDNSPQSMPNLKFKTKNNDKQTLVKSKQNFPLKPTPQSTSIIRNSAPYMQKKSDSISRLSSDLTGNPRRFLISQHGLAPNRPLKKDIKRKQLKENKITFSFTTSIRPEVLKPELDSKKLNKQTSEVLRSSVKQSPSKTSLQKRLESKLKSGDPKSLASEKYTTLILPNKNFDKSTDKSLSEEKFGIVRMENWSQETDVAENGVNLLERLKENTAEKIRLPKLRDTIDFSTLNSSNPKKVLLSKKSNSLKSNGITDVIQLASSNKSILTATSIEKPLKENVSYKCKMVCFEDKEDSKSAL